MPITVSTTERAGRVVLTVAGPADLGTLPAWQRALATLVADHPGRDLAVDLDDVTVLDDTVLGPLLGTAVAARDTGGTFTVICSREPLLTRLCATGVDRILDVESAIGPVTGR